MADEALRLARAAHRYVVHVLLRNDRGRGDTPRTRAVDWQDLLEHVTTHPAASR